MKNWYLFGITFVVLLVSIVGLGNVSVSPTVSDRSLTKLIIGKIRKPSAFSKQISVVKSVQRAVLEIAPRDAPIPEGQPRELKDLIKVKSGLCYDRSRAMEMMLRSIGFKVRHASLYRTSGKDPLRVLFKPGVPSHAIIEVLTTKGWLLVDSNSPWVALTQGGIPKNAVDVSSQPDQLWLEQRTDKFFDQPYVTVYGLYSRHGGFYPPYNPVPDFNISDLVRYAPSDG